ncbi:MAG: DNA mismatch repair protein MutL, partial [candidate division Zixibacteria bacterium]|nr:DNA mismatch repair protein MutL [candidate division Zixibacteria bacterium]NIW45758.1 DNA mismatch repair protein MutL [Gammaproteobacteria bacterium]NIR64943.1 DNA mismatch repair protein MutL [candidate division Zixibacteria bacterium]NIS46757.1 DNA mismatch repair protein MutL [candidate division Zixibacteria bacterium]NIU14886.1 DNA mismatch repair protein MutL [candidate division Zixibacteria bacterium]
EVQDDGSGIPRAEVQLAVSRFTTSKISNVNDLFNIATLGFRGEALASIASVSRMTLTSRAKGEEVGTSIIVDGGSVQGQKNSGLPEGTSVKVEQLFYNVPARLKFLKTDRTERKNIAELVNRYALAYASVQFILEIDQRSYLKTSGNDNR